jgi:DNA anti-recombination protein RmuC
MSSEKETSTDLIEKIRHAFPDIDEARAQKLVDLFGEYLREIGEQVRQRIEREAEERAARRDTTR